MLVKPNLLDIDILIESFLQRHHQGIITMHRFYFHSDDQLSLRALIVELTEELKTGCLSFFNKNSSIGELDPYLFYIANAFCKKCAIPVPSKNKTDYVCPGCTYLKKNSQPIQFVNKIFKCCECENEVHNSTNPKQIAFFR